MLGTCQLIAFVTVTDATRARRFYGETLGLALVDESPFALQFDCAGTMLRVALASHVEAAPYTVLGWRVDDIAATLQALAGRGIPAEIFDGLGQSADGVWQAPGGASIAWFKDPDGNLLSITQF